MSRIRKMLSLQAQFRWLNRAPWILSVAALAAVLTHHLVFARAADARLESLSAQIAAADLGLRSADASLAELPRVQQDVDELRQKLESARKLPQHQDLGQFLRDINTFGEEASLAKLTVQPGVPRRREMVSEIPVSVSFEADFLNAFSFLRRTEDMPRLTAVRGLSIKSLDGSAGTVEVQLSMALFFSDGL